MGAVRGSRFGLGGATIKGRNRKTGNVHINHCNGDGTLWPGAIHISHAVHTPNALSTHTHTMLPELDPHVNSRRNTGSCCTKQCPQPCGRDTHTSDTRCVATVLFVHSNSSRHHLMRRNRTGDQGSGKYEQDLSLSQDKPVVWCLHRKAAPKKPAEPPFLVARIPEAPEARSPLPFIW